VSDVYALVRSLRRNELPRNQNFELHATAIAAAARRLARFLRGIERDVRAATDIQLLEVDETQWQIRMQFSRIALERVVCVNAVELGLLCENAEIAARLRPARDADKTE
jgi:hypothetical protein